MIEANPRASRTVPFVCKAIGVPLAKLACRMVLGETIAETWAAAASAPDGHVSVKEAVLPFDRFAGADALLGPEMRSTGEVMGIARDFPTAFAKAQAAAGSRTARGRNGFPDGQGLGQATRRGAGKSAPRPRLPDRRHTRDCRCRSRSMGVPAQEINKIPEGSPNVVDLIERGEVGLVVNTPTGSGAGWTAGRSAPPLCVTAFRASRRWQVDWQPLARSARRVWARPSRSLSRTCTPSGKRRERRTSARSIRQAGG